MLALVAAALGCGPAEDPPALGEASSPIAGGYVDPDDSFVVGFYFLAGGSLCSGALIAPNVVLTARHCVSPTLGSPDGKIDCATTMVGEPGYGGGFFVTTAPEINIGNAGELLSAEVRVPAPTGAPFCGNDVAVIILQDNVDPNVAAPIEPRVSEAVVEGEAYSAIGYGATDDAGAGAGTRRRRDDLVVGCVAESCPEQIVAQTEWRGDEGVCKGDSGGPAIDGASRVIGVTSRGSIACASPVYGHVSAWAAWLKDTVAYASGLGQYDAPAWTEGTTVVPEHSAPVGESCSSDADCFTGRCVEQGGYCTRACTDAAPCPEGFFCAAGDPPVCLDTSPPAPAPKAAPEDDSGCATGRRGASARAGWIVAILAGWALGLRRRRARRIVGAGPLEYL